MRVLFVCSGNTCRSPMAARLLESLARAKGLRWSASSAGLAATNGAPMTELARETLAARGAPDAPHRAARLDAAALHAADVVYVMTRGQWGELAARFPAAKDKAHVLRQRAGLTPVDVADPIGGEREDYEAAADAIQEALEIIVERETHAKHAR